MSNENVNGNEENSINFNIIEKLTLRYNVSGYIPHLKLPGNEGQNR